MSHPIPFHTAEQLERALDALFRRVGARGTKGWVRRIVAFFFCQYCEAVIELLEGLLAEYRAGTLVFPGRADDSPTIPASHARGHRRTAPPRRSRAPQRAAANESPGNPEVEAAQSAARDLTRSPRRLAFAVAPPRPKLGRLVASPRGRFAHPSAVPRPPTEKIALGPMQKSTPVSLR